MEVINQPLLRYLIRLLVFKLIRISLKQGVLNLLQPWDLWKPLLCILIQMNMNLNIIRLSLLMTRNIFFLLVHDVFQHYLTLSFLWLLVETVMNLFLPSNPPCHFFWLEIDLGLMGWYMHLFELFLHLLGLFLLSLLIVLLIVQEFLDVSLVLILCACACFRLESAFFELTILLFLSYSLLSFVFTVFKIFGSFLETSN